MEDCHTIRKLINVICPINRLKEKNHMAISKEIEKAFKKFHKPFIIKTNKKLVAKKA